MKLKLALIVHRYYFIYLHLFQLCITRHEFPSDRWRLASLFWEWFKNKMMKEARFLSYGSVKTTIKKWDGWPHIWWKRVRSVDRLYVEHWSFNCQGNNLSYSCRCRRTLKNETLDKFGILQALPLIPIRYRLTDHRRC